jgi:methyl coenzyme M reductase gamma subunit
MQLKKRIKNETNKTTIFDHTTWFLGSATLNGSGSHTHKLRVDIDGVLYDIHAELVS